VPGAPAPAHATGRAVFRIRRLNSASLVVSLKDVMASGKLLREGPRWSSWVARFALLWNFRSAARRAYELQLKMNDRVVGSVGGNAEIRNGTTAFTARMNLSRLERGNYSMVIRLVPHDWSLHPVVIRPSQGANQPKRRHLQ